MEVELYKMTYKLEKDIDTIRILGEDFVKNNKNKGKLSINHKKYPLKEFISSIVNEPIKMKMILMHNIYNRSCIFKMCDSLDSISQESKKNALENLEIAKNELDNIYYNENENELERNIMDNYDIIDNEDSFYDNINSYTVSEIARTILFR